VGDWLFGCDVCQEVCPWNEKAAGQGEGSLQKSDDAKLQPAADANPVDLIGLFELDDQAFRDRFRHTPLWRAKRRGILRNAAIVLGNQRAAAGVPALRRGLEDSEPLIREACAWARGRIECEGEIGREGERERGNGKERH
jgi:epoxyqueuosine reductase